MPERFRVVCYHTRRYTSARIYLLPFSALTVHRFDRDSVGYVHSERVIVLLRSQLLSVPTRPI